MAAYFVLNQTVTDQRAYSEEYVPAVVPILAKYGGEVLAFAFQTEHLEGDPADGVVILRFPTEQAIRDFLDDPEYAPWKALRFRITTGGRALMVPEFQWPDAD